MLGNDGPREALLRQKDWSQPRSETERKAHSSYGQTGEVPPHRSQQQHLRTCQGDHGQSYQVLNRHLHCMGTTRTPFRSRPEGEHDSQVVWSALPEHFTTVFFSSGPATTVVAEEEGFLRG